MFQGNADELRAIGVLLVEEHLAEDVPEAAAIARHLSYPLWIRSTGEPDPRFCITLHSPDDLPLACAQAVKRSGSGKLLLQRATEGTTLRVWFPPETKPQEAQALAATHSTESAYRLVDALVNNAVPEPVARFGDWLRAAMLEADGWFEGEFSLVDSQAYLTGLWHCDAPHPAVAALVEAKGGAYSAVHWLQSRSGLVTGIEGESKAAAMPGIVGVHVAAAPGTILSHVIDEASRDRLGFVVAKGDTAEQALQRAREAANSVTIRTTSMLD